MKVKRKDSKISQRILTRLLPFTILIAGVWLFDRDLARTQSEVCAGEFIPVSAPLSDLGPNEYVRLEDGPTGFTGGLYPGGSSIRPASHESAGVVLGSQIVPLDVIGDPDPAGKIVMASIGMSNTASEFREFIDLAAVDSDLNPQLVIINGAQPGQTSEFWADLGSTIWQELDRRLGVAGLAPMQLQVAWIKLTQTGGGNFPAKAQALQNELEAVARNLKTHYPNIKLAYFSSRTRSYTYWNGLSPEPTAFETSFAVKWMIEKQINGDAGLNFDPANGPVVAPFLSWGPYLWIDGLNQRSDGLVWTQADLSPDCTHPSNRGNLKVAEQLMDFFKTDPTASRWFLAEDASGGASHRFYLPIIWKN